MSNQFAIYKSYLPSKEEVKPYFVAAILALSIFTISSVVTGQSNSESVIDTAITSVTEEAQTEKEQTKPTNSEESAETQTTSQVATEAASNTAKEQQEESKAKSEESKKKTEASKTNEAVKEAEKPDPVATASKSQDEMPSTGPVENVIVTIAILAIGYMGRNFIRSKAELNNALTR